MSREQETNGEIEVGAGKKRTLTEREKGEQEGVIANTSSDGGGEGDSISSSDSSSDSSSSGSSSTSSSGSSSSDEGAMDNLFEEDEGGRFLNVSCACNEAKFYIKRFARGSVGKCILFKGRWITPNEFQAISGRKSSKDWKRSIRLKGRCLKEFITQGLFQEHAKNCACKICSGDDVEMLKQEGEMALAAKRRRLSQADSHPITLDTILPVPPPPLITLVSDNTEKAPKLTRKKVKKTEVKQEPEENKETKTDSPGPHKIWSPSGEVAHHEGGSSNEEEYRPGLEVPGNSQLRGIVDSSDFLPRRSRRTTHRKHNGHRTELGTFTRKPSQWDSEEVVEFLTIQGYGDYCEAFTSSEIDGQSLFLLKEQHLMEKFSMKLGPALRLLDTISRLRHPPLAT